MSAFQPKNKSTSADPRLVIDFQLSILVGIGLESLDGNLRHVFFHDAHIDRETLHESVH